MADPGLDSSDGLIVGVDGVVRCWWANLAPIAQDYHDEDWGIPVADDAGLFEKLSLQVFQAGLSWLVMVRKRETFRQAFAGFDVERVARFDESDISHLLTDVGIVRHRGKIEAVIHNARRAVELIDAEGSLGRYFWDFESAHHTRPRGRVEFDGPTTTAKSTALAKDLKKRGWKFVGPHSVYLFMQAAGIVDNHQDGCNIAVSRDAARAFRMAAE